ncbi:HDOD domain-containing protein [Couchioplanes azureus]|uniref:HDOD domain-containing protein n=1 Tax=Couchioplanes caeruleus TaxID=56438 RepID=UPI001670A754|nr:HDOD domain-containing protein [Couchioplanes caeruleus]GGQ73183.1 two-component system response regulator [Couchioplanes caeruleus subsp. azureus]
MSKPRALFVDDEPRILDGLRRSLRGKRGEWDMDFVSEGAEALKLMADAHYDVVVSDMRMPGMDGAELLTQVSQRHPEVARVVLSGHIEPEATVQVAVAGHRFLTKPSDAETLTGVIDQLLVHTSAHHQEQARRIAGAVRAIPTLPEHADRIVALLAPDASLSDAVWTAMHDVGLTAKLLQLSNSRFFGAQPRNSSVESIVNAMGVPMVQAVAGAGHALRPASEWSPAVEAHLRAVWRHTVATACLVDLVASPANRPHAQAAALLQDVGRLVCLAGVPDGAECAVDLAAQTRDGVPFRDVGVELLHLWGLPAPIVSAVAQRDTPQSPDPSGLGVTAAVRTAHLLIQRTDSACPDGGTHEGELAQLLAHPQLRAKDVDWARAAEQASKQAASWDRPSER